MLCDRYIITLDNITALRYYDINDKEFCEQRDGKTIQARVITEDPQDYTANCSTKAGNIGCCRGFARFADTTVKSP